MNRRQFLRLSGTGIVASATMAEAGMLAEFLSWLQRKPTWFIPKPKVEAALGFNFYDLQAPAFRLSDPLCEEAIVKMWANFQPAPNTIWVTPRRYKEVMAILNESPTIS